MLCDHMIQASCPASVDVNYTLPPLLEPKCLSGNYNLIEMKAPYSILEMSLDRACLAAVLLCGLSAVSLLLPKSLYAPQREPAAPVLRKGWHGRSTLATEEVLDNGVNMDRAFGPLDVSRAPDGPVWSNSLALCTSIKWERPEDVLEWVQYYKYGPIAYLAAMLTS